jgi:hypothetical protein
MRQRKDASTQVGNVRRTLFFPVELDRKLGELANQLGVDLSKTIRRILSEQVDNYLQGNVPEPATAAPRCPLSPTVERLLLETAKHMGLTADTLKNVILNEQVLQYHAWALRKQSELQKVLERP